MEQAGCYMMKYVKVIGINFKIKMLCIVSQNW